jgi:imidazole glycerol-phosphate synthase subunit HisH
MTIALLDYGIGNLRSVQKALEAVGAVIVRTANPADLPQVRKIVLPGVGAFGDGMRGLEERELIPALKNAAAKGRPILGICLGMQLLFESSTELGLTKGLGFIKGHVEKFPQKNLKIPQTGWNQLCIQHESPLLKGIESGAYVYFNHSFYCVAEKPDETAATTTYGLKYTAIVQRGRLYGVQFHPEKSQNIGLQILKNFVESG